MSRYVEASFTLVVARCEECPHWFGYADSRVEAWKVARTHERAVHRGEKQALRALNSAATRRRES